MRAPRASSGRPLAAHRAAASTLAPAASGHEAAASTLPASSGADGRRHHGHGQHAAGAREPAHQAQPAHRRPDLPRHQRHHHGAVLAASGPTRSGNCAFMARPSRSCWPTCRNMACAPAIAGASGRSSTVSPAIPTSRTWSCSMPSGGRCPSASWPPASMTASVPPLAPAEQPAPGTGTRRIERALPSRTRARDHCAGGRHHGGPASARVHPRGSGRACRYRRPGAARLRARRPDVRPQRQQLLAQLLGALSVVGVLLVIAIVRRRCCSPAAWSRRCAG